MKTLLSFLFSTLIIALALTACNNDGAAAGPSSPDTASAGNSEDTAVKSYLPVASFIRGDMGLVDSFAAGILLKKESGNEKDSLFIKSAQFKLLGAEFLPAELDSASFHRMFTEALLPNPDNEGMVFMYTTNDANSSVRKVIVYTITGETTQKISRIYMEKELARGDTSISQKLTWKMREYLIIAENKQTAGGYNVTEVKKAIWDPQRFGE